MHCVWFAALNADQPSFESAWVLPDCVQLCSLVAACAVSVDSQWNCDRDRIVRITTCKT